MPDERPVVVVGASMGGLRVTEALRKAGYEGAITVIGEESHLPYNRPPLSKDVLSSVVSHEAVAFPQRAATADVDWALGSAVVSADLDAHTVLTADGAAHEWRALIIATGLRPRRLALPELPGRHTLRTLDDAMALRDELRPGQRVIVNGSGFIGCEVAATARKLGCEVTVVSSNELPMLRPLGHVLAAELQRRHEEHGVVFVTGRSVVGLLGESRVEGVVLDDGAERAADVVVEAIGADCNTEWLAASGLDLTDGVLTDPAMRAIGLDGRVHDDVYVVGDVARFPNVMFDAVPRRVEHWNIPTDTGRRAGAVLGEWLGRSVTSPSDSYEDVAAQPFAPMPSFWSNQFELSVQAFGLPGLADPDGVRLLEGDVSGDSITGYYRGDRLVGVIGFGMKAALMPYRALIAAGESRRFSRPLVVPDPHSDASAEVLVGDRAELAGKSCRNSVRLLAADDVGHREGVDVRVDCRVVLSDETDAPHVGAGRHGVGTQSRRLRVTGIGNRGRVDGNSAGGERLALVADD